jgi:hypothetical protein
VIKQGVAEQEACQYLVDVSFLTKSSPASSWSPNAQKSHRDAFRRAAVYHRIDLPSEHRGGAEFLACLGQ